MTELLRTDYDIICPELYALAGNPNDLTYPALYRAFSSFCDQHPQPLHLCGLSLGGILALNYCLDHPERVRSLVLIGTQYKMPRALLKVQGLVFRFMPSRAFRQFGMGKRSVIRFMESMTMLDFTDKLVSVSCNTLVLCGEKDRANIRAARLLAQGITGAQLQMLPDAGHEVNRDTPEVLSHVLRAFFSFSAEAK